MLLYRRHALKSPNEPKVPKEIKAMNIYRHLGQFFRPLQHNMRTNMSIFGSNWAPCGLHLSPFGGFWSPRNSVTIVTKSMGGSWTLLGHLLAQFGTIWAPLGHLLGTSWLHLSPFMAPFVTFRWILEPKKPCDYSHKVSRGYKEPQKCPARAQKYPKGVLRRFLVGQLAPILGACVA